MQDDYVELRKRFSVPLPLDSGSASGTGELIVFFEDGFVPPREEIKLPFVIPSVLVTLALPFYQARWTPPQPLLLLQDGVTLGTTEEICDIRALAVKSLQEKMPIILTRQLLRAIAKTATQNAAREKFGDLGQLFTMVYTYVSENADLRCWSTLPESVQLLRMRLPEGEHHLSLQHPGSLASGGVTVTIRDKGKTIVMISRAGEIFHTISAVF